MNSQSRVAVTWLAIAVLAAVATLLPSALGSDMMRYGYAISLVSGMLVLTAAIVAVVYWRRSVALSRIVSGKGLLAHWRYDADTWSRHLEEQCADQRSANRSRLAVLAAISLGIGLLFLLADRDAGRYVLLTMVALVVVSAVVAFAAPALQRRSNQSVPAEAYVAAEGALVGSDLHLWRAYGTRVEEARVVGGAAPHLVVSYSQATRTGAAPGGSESYTVSLPVPRGEEEAAERIAAALGGRQDR
jgi:hypothetical protein